MINSSTVLTVSAGLIGLYLIYMHIAVIKKDIKAELFITMPVIIGTLAWISASYKTIQYNVCGTSITLQLVLMIISWIWLSVNSVKTHLNNQKLKGETNE